MAVDYTKVFTVIGCYVDKINDYYAYIATYTSDQTAIETILSAQSLVRLEEDLVDVYADYKAGITDDIQSLISRVTTVLVDNTLIGNNFSFGQEPSLTVVWPALIKDMATTDKNVKANTATIGSITYASYGASAATVMTGTKLDAVTPPTSGGPAIASYYGLTTQLTPTSETLTLTCTSDSLPNGSVGSEVFQITGTGAGSGGYDPSGENAGILGSITVADSQVNSYVANAGFDSWTAGVLDTWSEEDGTHGLEFESSGAGMQGTGYSFKTIQSGNSFAIAQNMNSNLFTLGKSYFFGIWCAKNSDALADQTLKLIFTTGAGPTTVTFAATTTAWGFAYGQVLIPTTEISENVEIRIESDGILDAANDPVLLDNLIIAPCEYFEGIALGIVNGPNRSVVGDTATFTISNSDAGKFQTAFRKMYGVQLPTDATPTISDALVT